MELRHVYIGHLNTTTVVVLYYEIIYKMGPPLSENQVKESQSRVAPPLFAQAGVACDTDSHTLHMAKHI